MDTRSQHSPGLTLVSIPAIFLAIFVMSVLVQYFDVVIAVAFASEHTLALPAMWTFLAILIACGLWHLFTRAKLLTRAELICVLYAMLIAAPLLSQGFWHRIVAIIATNPRTADFEKLDATSDRLWPHGPNLLAGGMDQKPGSPSSPKLQGSATWGDVEVEPGRNRRAAVLVNQGNAQISMVRFRLPIEQNGDAGIAANRPYLVSILGRTSGLGPDSKYFCRFSSDENHEFTEAFTGSETPKITLLHKTGYRRIGAYGVEFSDKTTDHAWVEFGLSGPGRLELLDPKLFSVEALERIYTGRKLVAESQLKEVPPSRRSGLIIKPDCMWSPWGFQFILTGYIPWSDWAVPFMAWTSLITMIFAGFVAVNVVMRKQWLDNERYLMPLTRIPLALLGDDGGAKPVWKSALAWTGFFLAIAWSLVKAAHYYNPDFPDLTIDVPLAAYLSDPGWGGMFSTTRFEVNGVFLALAVFMELNVLISIVIGFWLFRLENLFGYRNGLTADPSFPYTDHQQSGAYLGYAVAGLFFSRQYLRRVLKAAIVPGAPGAEASDGEILSYRWALILLLGSIAGMAVWSYWLGMNIPGAVIFFLFLLTIGYVASKLRTECGTPWGYFTPGYFVPVMLMLGGMRVFGPQTILLCYIASFFLAPTIFFMIPGAQLEFSELGRRMRVPPGHILATSVLAIGLGMFLGGWVFLSNAYAMGGESFRYGWAFDAKPWYFFSYNQEMTRATDAYLAAAGHPVTSGRAATEVQGVSPSTWSFFFAGGVTLIFSALRQANAGFWFHPAGWVLGMTNFSDYVWGSCLVAWAIRGLSAFLGGAATVRNKLIPIFVGVFVGTVIAELLIGVHAAYLKSIGIEKVYSSLIP